jgi:hypothetical protein
MIDLIKKSNELIMEIEELWTDVNKRIENVEEYNTKTIISFADVEMSRLIIRTFNIDINEFKNFFKSDSNVDFFEMGANFFINELLKNSEDENHLFIHDQLWELFNQQKENVLKKLINDIKSQGKEEIESLNKYYYFTQGLKLILNIYNRWIEKGEKLNFHELITYNSSLTLQIH